MQLLNTFIIYDHILRLRKGSSNEYKINLPHDNCKFHAVRLYKMCHSCTSVVPNNGTSKTLGNRANQVEKGKYGKTYKQIQKSGRPN